MLPHGFPSGKLPGTNIIKWPEASWSAIGGPSSCPDRIAQWTHHLGRELDVVDGVAVGRGEAVLGLQPVAHTHHLWAAHTHGSGP
jgi:hypothetical protein